MVDGEELIQDEPDAVHRQELLAFAKKLKEELGRPGEAEAMLSAAEGLVLNNLFVKHSPRSPFGRRGLAGTAWHEDGGGCNGIVVLQCPGQPG
jgi:hypothetical protein